MRCIVGVQIIESGTVTVLGHPAGSPVLRDRVGYVTQSPSVYADLSVRDNVVYFARAIGLRGTELREAVDRTLAEVDLVSYADQLVQDLSGGQESRVSLAAALVGRPEPARPRRAHRRPRPGAATRPLGPLPPPRRPRALARRVESRHGRGHPLRPARPAPRGPRPRRRHPGRAARSGPAPSTPTPPSSPSSTPRPPGPGRGGRHERRTHRRHLGPRAAPGAHRPPHHRPHHRRALRAPRPARLDLHRHATSSTPSGPPCSASSR